MRKYVKTRFDRFGRLQGNEFHKRTPVPPAASPESAPTSMLDFLNPPFGQVIEIGVTLKAGVTGATLAIYRDATPSTADGDPVVGANCFPLVSSTTLTGGAGVTYHLVTYTHNGANVAIRLLSITDGNTPDEDEPAIISYRWC